MEEELKKELLGTGVMLQKKVEWKFIKKKRKRKNKKCIYQSKREANHQRATKDESGCGWK